MSKRRAFTLVELLVVISVIALLIGILVPSLRRARESGKRTACSGNLRQIGVAFEAYIQANGDRLPFASYMPSVSAAPLDLEDDHAVYIADVLRPNLGGQNAVFHCPSDVPGRFTRDPPNVGKSYFQSEKSSYEYRVRYSVMGHTMQEAAAIYKRMGDQAVSENTIWIMRDVQNFHGAAGKPGSRRYLYVDGHVSDFENY